MWFFYDSTGKRVGLVRNGYVFYYVYNLQGDVIGIMRASNGQLVATYEYDAWGNCTNVSNASGWAVGTANPFRYRGYYYDTETGYYYLQSRYYDPDWGRFINADAFTSTDISGILSANMFAYCENNPVIREDSSGEVFETVFDAISLGASIIEVAVNPADPWAWAGLVGDVVDLIPFVTGVGELTRSAKIASGTVIDSAKSIRKTVPTSTGAYEILFESGKNYVGKGDFGRAITSAINHSKPNKLNNFTEDAVTSISWKACKNNRDAFIEEYALMTRNGVRNSKTYNQIWSPGLKYHAGGR